MARSSRKFSRASEIERADGEVAQRCEGAGAGADAASILGEADVADVVEPVLDAPNVKVHSAGIQDRDGGKRVLKAEGGVHEKLYSACWIVITVNWQNKLLLTGHLFPVDTSLHFADSQTHPLSSGYVPIVTHLHGGHNDSIFDGLPDQWFTQSRGGPA